ncbi:MAG: glycosyltransferase, partial [Bacteroidetes bacterium]|nr:glycosyltransferase [Bacteroidota bacterium]
MQLALQIIFWLCILLLLHSYVLFPLLLQLLAKGRKENNVVYVPSVELPHVYLLMSAYNEQKVIQENLESAFDTSYPLDKISFYIGSDNSSDETNQIITAFAAKYPQVKFTPYYERNGKSGVLNKLYAQIAGLGITERDVFI